MGKTRTLDDRIDPLDDLAPSEADPESVLRTFEQIAAMLDVPAPSAMDPENTSAALLAALDAMAGLADGWNSYSAPPPAAIAIENAKTLVAFASALGSPPERVEPSAMGGVEVRFEAGTREVSIEFYNGGTAHALFVDHQTRDMSTAPVTTTSDGYRAILTAAERYLRAK